MSDHNQEGTGLITAEKELLSEYDRILEEYKTQKVVKPVKYNPRVTSFIIPATAGRLQKVVTLEKEACKFKKLIFSAIYTASYQCFFTEDYSPSARREFQGYASFIVDYLNAFTFVEGKEVLFFRSYEAFRIHENNVLPQSTGLASLVKWITLASTISAYSKKLTHWQVKFLVSVSKIRALGNADYEAKQVTLTDWFGFSTWLRRDDVGVGHELYSKLASPKALVTSFVATITAELNEIQLAKDALIDFFIQNKVQPSDFPLAIKKKAYFKYDHDYRDYFAEQKKNSLNRLREIYHASQNKDKHVRLAMELSVREFVQITSSEFMLKRFFDNKPLKRIISSGGKRTHLIVTNSNETFFGPRLLNELVRYANSPCKSDVDKPKSVAEEVIFSWLMAYQTVQPSDIYKLKLNDFKFVKRASGQVTHIDLEYFKGRANNIYQVRTLETKKLLGRVILRYVQDLTNDSIEDRNKKLITKSNSFAITARKIFELCDGEMASSVNDNLLKEKASPVFIKSILAILRKGKKHNPKGKISYKGYLISGDLKCRRNLFTLTAIKNSSVHSRSDTFTPTQLINYHSHTDDVEQRSYLSNSNEEWLNNTGLITRAVMQDLVTNLYRASLTERVKFNSEFSHAAEIIANRKNDTLSQMKMVTGKDQGEVNHLGLVKKPVRSKDDFPDTIYLLDTPETVFKMLHYLNQVKQNHHLLLAASSEFLLFTVLPTVEWIEELFDKKSFSKESVSGGHKLFKHYRNELPPLFQNQVS